MHNNPVENKFRYKSFIFKKSSDQSNKGMKSLPPVFIKIFQYTCYTLNVFCNTRENSDKRKYIIPKVKKNTKVIFPALFKRKNQNVERQKMLKIKHTEIAETNLQLQNSKHAKYYLVYKKLVNYTFSMSATNPMQTSHFVKPVTSNNYESTTNKT